MRRGKREGVWHIHITWNLQRTHTYTFTSVPSEREREIHILLTGRQTARAYICITNTHIYTNVTNIEISRERERENLYAPPSLIIQNIYVFNKRSETVNTHSYKREGNSTYALSIMRATRMHALLCVCAAERERWFIYISVWYKERRWISSLAREIIHTKRFQAREREKIECVQWRELTRETRVQSHERVMVTAYTYSTNRERVIRFQRGKRVRTNVLNKDGYIMYSRCTTETHTIPTPSSCVTDCSSNCGAEDGIMEGVGGG